MALPISSRQEVVNCLSRALGDTAALVDFEFFA
jgi:hypothetical protein